MFSWASTPEGHSYWEGIAKDLSETKKPNR
jgi:hypothetical protein